MRPTPTKTTRVGSKRYSPRLDDFFPHTARGYTRDESREMTARIDTTGKAMNVATWKDERGFHRDTPLEYCR